LQKRMAGYLACSSDYVLRFDADEVLYFDEKALERYLASRRPVAEMEMPMYFSPGWIEGAHPSYPRLPRQGCLFDRRKILPEEHLDYLWLISKDDWSTRTTLPRDHPVFEDPIAFAAHLTGWRTAETAIQRGAFYIFNYARNYGLPWHPALKGNPLPDSSEVLEHVEAAVVSELIRSSQVVGGHHHRGSYPLARSPLSIEQEQPLLPLFDRFLESHTRMHASLWRDFQSFVEGVPLYFEITAPESLAALAGRDGPCFEIEASTARDATATVSYLLSEPPWQADVATPVEVDGNHVRIIMPSAPLAPESYVRRVLEVKISTGALDRIARLRGSTMMAGEMASFGKHLSPARNDLRAEASLTRSASAEVMLYVVGGSPHRNPAARFFPVVNRRKGESKRTHLERVTELIDAAMASGGTHLLVPREQADWLGDHPLVADYFAKHHEMVDASADTGIVFALYP
jgi:hypothetical protein